jgi:hypothetical protein
MTPQRTSVLVAFPLLLLGSWLHAPSAWSQATPPDEEAADPARLPTEGLPKAPPPAEAPAPELPSAPPPAATEQYDVRLRELEEQVVGLKEKIFRSKTRLLLLKEQLLNEVVAEAKCVIVHTNEMGSNFKLIQVLYHLDSEKIYYQDENSGVLEESSSIDIYTGNVLPGNHVLSVEMDYRGDSPLFTYLQDYVFKLKATYTFYATKGRITTVKAVGYLKDDGTHLLTDRPSINFAVQQVSYSREKPTAAPEETR